MVVCANCEALRPTMFHCKGCYLVRYCSHACQKEHWKVHKKACRLDLEIKRVCVTPRCTVSMVWLPVHGHHLVADAFIPPWTTIMEYEGLRVDIDALICMRKPGMLMFLSMLLWYTVAGLMPKFLYLPTGPRSKLPLVHGDKDKQDSIELLKRGFSSFMSNGVWFPARLGSERAGTVVSIPGAFLHHTCKRPNIELEVVPKADPDPPVPYMEGIRSLMECMGIPQKYVELTTTRVIAGRNGVEAGQVLLANLTYARVPEQCAKAMSGWHNNKCTCTPGRLCEVYAQNRLDKARLMTACKECQVPWRPSDAEVDRLCEDAELLEPQKYAELSEEARILQYVSECFQLTQDMEDVETDDGVEETTADADEKYLRNLMTAADPKRPMMLRLLPSLRAAWKPFQCAAAMVDADNATPLPVFKGENASVRKYIQKMLSSGCIRVEDETMMHLVNDICKQMGFTETTVLACDGGKMHG